MNALVVCPACGRHVRDDADTCPFCGAVMPEPGPRPLARDDSPITLYGMAPMTPPPEAPLAPMYGMPPLDFTRPVRSRSGVVAIFVALIVVGLVAYGVWAWVR